jgi:hypothetical protein
MHGLSIVGQEMCRTKVVWGGGRGGGITLNTPIENAQNVIFARFDYFDLVAQFRVIRRVTRCCSPHLMLHPLQAVVWKVMNFC